MSLPPLALPGRTLFGRGTRHRVPELLPPGAVLLVRGGSARWADALAARLRQAGRDVHLVTGQGEPSLPVVEGVLSRVRPKRPASVVAVGGGAVIDLGKALAALLPGARPPLDHLEVVGQGLPLEAVPLPFIAVPTTAGTGAEATKNAVIDVPDHRRKVSLRDARMLPDVAVLDADLSEGTPWSVTLACGMDALTQLIEPYLCSRARPDVDALCRAAIPRAMAALLRLSRGEDAEARDTLLMSAHLSGIALANAGLGAVHGLAGVIGGQTHAPHGAICARLLPGVLRANRAACIAQGLPITRFDEVDTWIAGAFGTRGEATALLERFLAGAGLPPLASDVHLDRSEVARLAAASSSMRANPVGLSVDALVQVIAGGQAL